MNERGYNSPNLLPRRQLGRDGPEVTLVGLGAWAIGGPWARGWGAQSDQDSVAAIRHAVACGVNWIDTAPVYGDGHSEEVVGRAVSALPAGDRPMVFTKCGRVSVDGQLPTSVGRPDVIRAECEASLRRLQTDALDLLQLHWPPQDGTPLEETWGAMAELREAGKVRRIGVSNTSLDELQRIEPIAHVEVVQPPLSMIDRRAQAELLPWCREHGTGVIAYSPMQSGMLSGAFDRARIEALDETDWRRRASDFNEPKLSRNLSLVARLRPLAAERSVSVAELAIAWVIDQPGVTAAIVGARSAAQVDGWIGAASLELDDELRAALADVIVAPGVTT